MATLNKKLAIAALAVLGFPGCGKLAGLNTSGPPLAQINFQVTGDFASVQRSDTLGQTPQLRGALVWGAQWLPEPFCVLPPESPAAAAVIAAGCPDSFRFVPNRADADVPITPGVPSTISLINVPAADVMVGDVTARVAYASLIVYDDRNGNGALDFHHPPQHRRHGQSAIAEDAGPPTTRDIVYGASFISMTLPDQRVAYREGAFNASVAFYPRNGCDPPPPAFSILSAGGFPKPDFSQPAVLLAALNGQLPAEDPNACGEATLDQTVVNIPLQAPADFLTQLDCTVNDGGGTTYYYDPPATSPDLTDLPWACVGLPQLSAGDAGIQTGLQLVLASAPSAACQYVTHYTLRGCDTDPNCSLPSWDLTAAPPSWWPCPTTP
ncbi:MAG: hypothetical protein WCG85_10020 [Polyangia bacterium]